MKHSDSSGSEKMMMRTDHMAYMDGMDYSHDIFDRVIAKLIHMTLWNTANQTVRAIKWIGAVSDDSKRHCYLQQLINT